MKVVIVAKTRMGSGACIGGLTFDGRSLRLVAPDAGSNDQFNKEYEIGDVWDVDCTPEAKIIAPHVENVIIRHKRRLPPIEDVAAFVEHHMPPCEGGVDVLYEGLTQTTKAGVQYISERSGVPPYSTMFWRPDKPLQRDDDAKRIRYRYPTAEGGRTLTFVGFQEPLPEIPAGTLLRVSLAHWWRPERMPEGELRCYVQLSGWYLPQEAELWQESAEMPLVYEPADDPAPIQRAQADGAMDMDTAQATLKRVFGYDIFRPLQAEIIDNILHKRDSVAIMPTGSGKSLCYQLPALLFSGLTVVVSPLISLMQDQVGQLRELGIAAVFLNSTLSYQEYLRTTARIRARQVRLLYAAPETLLRPETLLLLQQVRVDCLTIDEAHCISEWGHDFRPEYRQLVEVRHRLADAVCLAVTATATKRVRQDIKETLNIADADEYIASFDRQNLFLAVEPRTNGLSQTLSFLEGHRDQAGIIYCSTKKQVDELAEQLSARGWPAVPYHAGLENGTRLRHQRRFTHEEGIIIVATIAFGMGIDKSNVRFVLHYNIPKNLEGYYQQIGRSGRDSLKADCLLLFGTEDLRTIRYFINMEESSRRSAADQRLQAMLSFCKTNGCRRKPLLSYFGETYAKPSCDMCDNCQTADAEVSDDRVLFDLLRAKRLELARDNSIPPYVIFSDRSLKDMATTLPQTRKSFADVYGVGDIKLEKYAGDFLPIIQKYCQDNAQQEKRQAVRVRSRRSADVGGRPAQVNEAYNAGHSSESLTQHVVALGKSDDCENVPELIAALEDPNGNVRRLAASALGKLGDKRAVLPLLNLLETEDKPQVRQYAVKALGKIGGSDASSTLRHIVDDESEREYTRGAARTALRQIG